MAKCSQCGLEIAGFSFGKQKSICKWCVQHERAQRGELPEDDVQPVMTNPWERSATDSMFFTQLFVLMNVLVFVAMCVSGVSPMEPTSQQLIHWGANYGPYTLGGQPWRLISNVFLHIGIIHIALNMWCLWSLGELAEKLYGHVTFLFVYLTTGIAASLTSVWWHPGTVSAGASGAVFGVAGALIASYYLGDFSLPQGVVKASLSSVVTFAGYNLIFGAVSGRTDNAAHVGGLVSGLILGAAIAKFAPAAESWAMRATIVVLGLTMAGSGFLWLQRGKGYDVHLQGGYMALAQGDADRAISEFQKAVSKQPNSLPPRLALANAYRMKKDYGNEEAQLEQALALNPKNDGITFRLGSAYLEHQKIPKAREFFQQVLSTNPKNAYGHYGLAMVASAEEKYEEAINEYSRSVEFDPEFSEAYYQIGLIHTKLNRYDEAIVYLQKAAQAADASEIELALADAYKAKGMTKESEAATAKAAQLKAEEDTD